MDVLIIMLIVVMFILIMVIPDKRVRLELNGLNGCAYDNGFSYYDDYKKDIEDLLEVFEEGFDPIKYRNSLRFSAIVDRKKLTTEESEAYLNYERLLNLIHDKILDLSQPNFYDKELALWDKYRKYINKSHHLTLSLYRNSLLDKRKQERYLVNLYALKYMNDRHGVPAKKQYSNGYYGRDYNSDMDKTNY
jgi:hypothetical protein